MNGENSRYESLPPSGLTQLKSKTSDSDRKKKELCCLVIGYSSSGKNDKKFVAFFF